MQPEAVVLINAFEVPEGEDGAFLQDWERACESLSRQEGYVSTRLHRSLSPQADFRFVNVALWQSAQAFQAATSQREFRSPPLATAPAERVDLGMGRILRARPQDTPAYVLGWRWDILAWNGGACDLLVDFDALTPARRNLVELMFLDAGMRARYLDWDEVARITLANFRAALARNIDRPEAKALVDHLRDSDPDFAKWWDLHEVQEKTSGAKRFRGRDGEPSHWQFQSRQARGTNG
jgi:heme-degrading monooxygenase HmoA